MRVANTASSVHKRSPQATLTATHGARVTLRGRPQLARLALPTHRRLTSRVRAAASVRELLSAGKVKYESGDRMGALRLWEEIPSTIPPATQQERVTSAYNQTCVHASFGDLELAQITLRDAVLEGLDFRQMLQDPKAFDEDAVVLKASQQVGLWT